MKKLVLTLAIVFAGIMSMNAQMWVGGGLGAVVEKDHMAFAVAPEIGYTFDNEWQIALGVDYDFERSEYLTGTITNNQLVLQPYVRYVGGTIGHKFFLFADLCGDIGLLDKQGAYAVTIQPGIAWQPCDNKKFTAAFRFARIGYDHGIYEANGFILRGALAAPRIGIYYSL